MACYFPHMPIRLPQQARISIPPHFICEVFLLLVPPVAYSGAKVRLAPMIIPHIQRHDLPFIDLCCGTGAISVALVASGRRPNTIRMVDAGPWGAFWATIGAGRFDMASFKARIADVPTDPKQIQAHLVELAAEPVGADSVAVHLLLQAGAFGGKPIWHEAGRWCTPGFRGYWEPTATSSRRSPVNPMMPMPTTLVERISRLQDSLYGVWGQEARVEDVISQPLSRSVIYIDPPYPDTTGYGFTLDLPSVLLKLSEHVVYASSPSEITDHAICLSKGRAKGGINGNRRTANAEWLSCSTSFLQDE